MKAKFKVNDEFRLRKDASFTRTFPRSRLDGSVTKALRCASVVYFLGIYLYPPNHNWTTYGTCDIE